MTGIRFVLISFLQPTSAWKRSAPDCGLFLFSPGGLKVEPLANFEIRVGMSRDFEKNPMCGERVGQLHYGEVWTSKCEPPISGQYVSVQRFGKVFMTICEVAVFARLGR